VDYCGETTSRAGTAGTAAIFDPITTRDAQNNTRLVYTQDVVYPGSGIDPTGPKSSFLGCVREAYFGLIYTHNNDGHGTVFYSKTDGTDAQAAQDATHPLKQMVSATWINDTTGMKATGQGACVFGDKTPN
jgi:hypothetical protein